ncbi:hypothetical protein ACL9RI_17155 [Janthinobacterium sp. Mn2066]|uniref:hypothetical protein n=1 Tax=Janthinobacterium sp. Mn2066 TaxID=3395264 RepID=UPI003BE90100
MSIDEPEPVRTNTFSGGPMADHRTTPLQKSDLQFRYPAGATGNDNPALRGTPDNVLLNRGEWYEVLYFINKFANEYGTGSALVAKKAERLIQRYLPSDQRSQAHVIAWLLSNWEKHGEAPII